MLQNAPDCTIPPKEIWGSMPPNLLPNPWLRHASQAAPPPKKKKNSWPPLTNPAYAHELLLKNLLRIHPGRQMIVCSTLYVYALQNLFKGQKMTKIVAQHILKCIVFKYYVTMCP